MNAEALPTAFVDTNILVHALAAADDRRSPVARRLVRDTTELSAGGAANPQNFRFP
ncbi:MAG: hypothetical protein Q8N47_02520 [Bryobacterales bacterium]|nr:hypothetical protein [Bryobacterales bacterium]